MGSWGKELFIEQTSDSLFLKWCLFISVDKNNHKVLMFRTMPSGFVANIVIAPTSSEIKNTRREAMKR